MNSGNIHYLKQKSLQIPDEGISIESKDKEMNFDMQPDTFMKEIKDDMREREERSERRFQEQQELLLNRIDKKLDDRLGNIEDDIKELKSSNVRWSIGIIASIVVAIIGAIPQLIQVITSLMQN
ncbi:hypothetical protein ACFW0C_08990 [Aerococcus sp. NPDC058936]|uniref:hypothetical protein n=1 Tax=Aerococcus sp. NPDC058936 TaxID=3346674 RepID=UPI00366DD906